MENRKKRSEIVCQTSVRNNLLLVLNLEENKRALVLIFMVMLFKLKANDNPQIPEASTQTETNYYCK